MEYKIIDLVFPIFVHFLALQLTGILGHWRCGFSDHAGGRHHNAIVLLALPERSEPVEKRKKKDNLDTVDHRDRGGGRAEYSVFGTDVVSGIGLWDYQ